MERIVRAAARNQSSWMAGVARIQGGGVHRVGPLRVVEHGGDATVLFPWRRFGIGVRRPARVVLRP